MTRGSFAVLERCLRTPRVHNVLQVSTCNIHSHHKPNATLFSRHHRQVLLNTSYCRHSSHIVKSPYEDINIPNKLIPEIIWETVDKFPESRAIKCGLTGRAYTFAEIQKLSYRFANSLRRAGFIQGEIIALVLPNCPEFAIITLGALEAELSMSFINHVYTDVEICHQLKDSGSVCIVTATEKIETILSAVAKLEETTQSKPIRRIIAVDVPLSASLPSGVVRFSEMIGSDVDASPKSSRVRPDDLAFLPYSSGTTGLPKGVCLSHRNIVSNIGQLFSSNTLQIHSPGEGQDTLLGFLPFYHLYGLATILIASLARGGQIVTLPKFEPESFINSLDREMFSILFLVPPTVLFLGNSSKVVSKHLTNLRYLVSGAAPLGIPDLERVKAKLHSGHNLTIVQVYGMTELSPAATLPVLPPKDMATIGVPLANTLAKVINPETGDTLGMHQAGELCIKGPQVMLGYHNNPKATSEILDSEGWLRTGDMVYFDEDSHFYIKDRLKELIKVKGFQVPPAELEELLRTHPCVNDVGVIGVPCPRDGETPVAYLVTKSGAKLTFDDIKNFLSDKVSRHKQVSKVIFCDSIPKTLSGKILRKELRSIYKRDHQLQVQ